MLAILFFPYLKIFRDDFTTDSHNTIGFIQPNKKQ